MNVLHLSQSRLVMIVSVFWSITMLEGTHRTANDFLSIVSMIWSVFNAIIFWLYIWFEDMITSTITTSASIRTEARIVFSIIFETKKQKAFKSNYSRSLFGSRNSKEIVQYQISNDHCFMFSEIGANISKHFCCKSSIHALISSSFIFRFFGMCMKK